MDKLKRVERSQTLLINSQSKLLEQRGLEIIKFGFGQSPFLPPEDVIESLRENVHRKEYSSVQGDEELRFNISKFHEAHNGLSINPDDIFIAPGSKILLFNILAAFKSLDVLIPGPSWVSYEPQVRLLGHQVLRCQTKLEDRWRLTPDLISEAIKRKTNKNTLLILNYPGNPDGLTYSQTELQAIVEVARKNEIYILSDEIYGILDHRMNHVSLASLYPERTLTTTGMSKWCGAGGWRLGICMLSPGIAKQFKDVLLGIGSETYSCAPMPVQIAARKAYSSYEGRKQYIENQLYLLSKISRHITEAFNASDIHTNLGEGGFYLFPSFQKFQVKLEKSGISSSEDLAKYLLEKLGIATLPGSAFGMQVDSLTLRIAYVDFDTDQLTQDNFDITVHCSRMLNAVSKICRLVEQL